jgi:hypothetical protein
MFYNQDKMKRRLPAIAIIITALSAMAYLVFMAPMYVDAIYTSAQKLIQSPEISQAVQNAVRPYLPQTTPDELLTKINQYRTSVKRPEFLSEADICYPLEQSEANSQDIFSVCKNCSHATMLTLGKYALSNQIIERLLADEASAETLQSAVLTHLCVADKGETLSLFFVKKGTITPKEPAPVRVAPSSPPTYFTEDQLWQSLVDYRHAHGKTDIIRDENVCSYARKRVNDHIEKMKNTAKEEYPNPDKYPLDAHAGFSSDAESGLAFEITDKSQLAENLAYWPSAKAASHIIEWGWDTSTEGHREAQLSNTWTHACLTGNLGFYVAIYAK